MSADTRAGQFRDPGREGARGSRAADCGAPVRGAAASREAPSWEQRRAWWADSEERAPSAREDGAKALSVPQVSGRGRDDGTERRHSAWVPLGGRAEARRGAVGAHREQHAHTNRSQPEATGNRSATQTRLRPHPRRSAPSPPGRPVRRPIRRPRWLPCPEAPPRASAPLANGRPRPGAQCAQPARSRLRARKANPTRRGRRSGPAAAAASPRIGCTVPTRKSSSAARQRRASAMTQEYDK